MQTAIVVKGRIISPTTIELDEPISQPNGSVEIIVRSLDEEQIASGETIFEFLRRLPPGTRTKEDIDRQIRQERNAWRDR
jgi:hypothetical protein